MSQSTSKFQQKQERGTLPTDEELREMERIAKVQENPNLFALRQNARVSPENAWYYLEELGKQAN